MLGKNDGGFIGDVFVSLNPIVEIASDLEPPEGKNGPYSQVGSSEFIWKKPE